MLIFPRLDPILPLYFPRILLQLVQFPTVPQDPKLVSLQHSLITNLSLQCGSLMTPTPLNLLHMRTLGLL